MKRSAWRYLWKSEDIRKKLLITLLLLVIYRLAANIPVPGINHCRAFKSGDCGWRGWQPVQPAGLALGWHRFALLHPGDGCVSLHYCPDYYPASGPDYPGLGAQVEG